MDFKWTPKREKAALALASGYTNEEAAEVAGVAERTIYLWKSELEFSMEVDRLSLMVGIASRAERLRIAMQVVKQKIRDDGSLRTNRDLLDWLKFAQSETDGVKLDLTSLLEAATSVADTRPAGTGAEGCTCESCDCLANAAQQRDR
jgi:DNA-binding XRE family transcriptional regulator